MMLNVRLSRIGTVTKSSSIFTIQRRFTGCQYRWGVVSCSSIKDVAAVTASRPVRSWFGDEQVHSQLLRKKFGHELSLDAVARAVERRSKRPDASFPGGDADDPSASAA